MVDVCTQTDFYVAHHHQLQVLNSTSRPGKNFFLMHLGNSWINYSCTEPSWVGAFYLIAISVPSAHHFVENCLLITISFAVYLSNEMFIYVIFRCCSQGVIKSNLMEIVKNLGKSESHRVADRGTLANHACICQNIVLKSQ
jgi:hypothetical protein